MYAAKTTKSIAVPAVLVRKGTPLKRLWINDGEEVVTVVVILIKETKSG